MDAQVDLNIESSGWGAMVLAEMDAMRETHQLCDISLVSPDGPPIPAHSLVLSGGSAFFKQVLEKARGSANNKQSSVVIKCGFSHGVLSHVCDFLYRGRALPRLSQIAEMERAAKTFGVNSLLSLCEVFNEQGGLDITSVTENGLQSAVGNATTTDPQYVLQSYTVNATPHEPQAPTTYPENGYQSNHPIDMHSQSQNSIVNNPLDCIPSVQENLQNVPPNASLVGQSSDNRPPYEEEEEEEEDNHAEEPMDYHEDIPHESLIAAETLTTIQHSDLLDITHTLRDLDKMSQKHNASGNVVTFQEKDLFIKGLGKKIKKKDGEANGKKVKKRKPRKKKSPGEVSVVKAPVSREETVDSMGRRRYKHPCDLCPRSFTTKQRLDGHRATHTGQRLHKCNLCGKSYIQIEYLREHMTIHAGIMPFQCSKCQKRFRTMRACKKHEQRHIGPPKKFHCTLCPLKFKSNENLQYHIRVHNGERPYKCKHCDKTFTCTMNLNRHLPFHSDVKPFKCSQCEMHFRRRGGLRDHMRIHSAFRPFVCEHPNCGAGFRIRKELTKHVKAIHAPPEPSPSNKPVRPKKRVSVFESTIDLTLDEPLQCLYSCPADDCPSKFLHNKQLHKHLLLFHPQLLEKKASKTNQKDIDEGVVATEATTQDNDNTDGVGQVQGEEGATRTSES